MKDVGCISQIQSVFFLLSLPSWLPACQSSCCLHASSPPIYNLHASHLGLQQGCPPYSSPLCPTLDWGISLFLSILFPMRMQIFDPWMDLDTSCVCSYFFMYISFSFWMFSFDICMTVDRYNNATKDLFGVPNFYLFVWSTLYMLQYLANASVATFDHCQLNRGHIYYLNNV